MKIEKQIDFRSNGYDESSLIERVSIELSDVTINNIKKAQEVIKNNDIPIETIKLKLSDDYQYIGYDDVVINEWRDDGGCLLVYKNSVYFYAQCKYDSSSQIESEELTIN